MKAAPRILKRKIKMLSSELKMLQSYRDDAFSLNKEYEAEFLKDIMAIKERLPDRPEADEDPPEPEGDDTFVIPPDGLNKRWKKTDDGWECEDSSELPEEAEAKNKPVPPPWAKKLYKKIALVSHPDRTLEDRRKDKLNRIFRESAMVMDTGDYKSLLGFALELEVDIEDVEVPMIPMLTDRIESLKSEISEIEKTLPWLWGESKGIIEMRANIAITYFAQRGISLKKQDAESIIMEIDTPE